MPDDHVTDLLASMHSHLEATGERPVSETESRWLGEAEAIAADLRHAEGLTEETIRDRTTKVDELLAEVDGTGDDDADEHVAAAQRALDRIEDALQD